MNEKKLQKIILYLSKNLEELKLKFLSKIFAENCSQYNPVNNLRDADNLRVLVWTFPKTGTSTLASSFQQSIDKTSLFKNVVHCHHEQDWINFISPELQEINFSFKLLIEFINKKGIKPLVIQSYRCPVDFFVSSFFHKFEKEGCQDTTSDELNAFFNDGAFDGQEEYINYLKKTFNGIWTHEFNKKKGFGFHSGESYNILYTTIEDINSLPKNIKSIKELQDYHDLAIHIRNTHKNKKGYKKFKNNLDFKKESIDRLYKIHSEPLNFFYSEERILEMKESVFKKFVKNNFTIEN